MMNDRDLLNLYLKQKSEAAFAELVDRHLNLVYSAALRQVRSPQLAEEVAQSAFADLARDAGKLRPDTILTAWLYQVARRTAIDVVRRESRRQARERISVEIAAMNTTADWNQIEPLLDEGMDALEESDRAALLLRFFENKSLREVGETLGTSDDAAQKRVSRAVERLREFFAKHGVAVGATGLVATISANAIQAAPTGMAASIATAAFAGAATIATSTILTHTTMSILGWKTATAVITAAALAGTGMYYSQQGEINRLRDDNRNLAAVRDSLKQEKEKAVALAATNNEEIERLKKNQNDLVHLRSEVGQLRHQVETAKAESTKQAKPRSSAPVKTAHAPGAYIASDQLGNVGYATPEAGMETMIWAMMHSTYDDVSKSLSPKIQEAQFKDSISREDFEDSQAKMAALLKGVQIVARKTLANGMVELKVKQDYDPDAVKQAGLPVPSTEYMLQPMVNVDGEWKLGGSTHPYDSGWDSGDVLSYAQ